MLELNEQKKKDLELLETTIATLFKAREYARDFRRQAAISHLDRLIKDLQLFKERISNA